MDKAIEIKNLTFRYDYDLPIILDDISLDINYGEITLFTGHSGCGKSSLLYLISRIIPDVNYGVYDGVIKVNNQDISTMNIGDVSRVVGCVMQNPDLQIINQCVEDEIAFGCENLGFSPKLIKELIIKYSQLLNLDPSALTKKLSGGEKERLLLASVLAMGQKIILLDEPLANLDLQSIKIVTDTLVKLKKEGYAVIIAEHRLEFLQSIVDKTFLFSGHKVTNINLCNYQQLPVTLNLHNNLQTTDKMILTATNLGFKYQNKCTFNNVDCTINEGDHLLILGENGCGKTTLLKVLGRVLKLKHGQIKQSLNSKFKYGKRPSKEWFRQVGYIFQNPSYQLFMPSVLKELNYSSTDPKYLNYLIDTLDLKPLLNCHPQALSEGQKRRLTVACILAAKPKLLLLDEPTVGQDDKHLDTLIKVLIDYQNRFNATIVSVSHDLRFAYSLCNKVLIMNKNNQHLFGDRLLLDKYFKIKEK